MKNMLLGFYAAALSCLCCSTALSQPILTASTYTPVVGDTFNMNFVLSYTPAGMEGANQTWDFSSLVSSQDFKVEYVTPSSTGYGGSFSGSTIASSNPGVFGFFQASGNSYYNLGNVSMGYITTVMSYSDKQKWMEFPFTYGDSLTDAFAGSFTTSFTFNRAGNIKVKADGYGTLILPDTIIDNVLRIKMEEDYGDDIYYPGYGTYPYQSYVSETYSWILPGTHHPVMSTTRLWVDGNLNSQYTQWMKKEDIKSGIAERELSATVRFYPNPSNGAFYLEIDRPLTNARAEVYSMDGSLVSEQQLSGNRNAIDLRRVASGLYYTRIMSKEGVKTLVMAKE